MNFEIIKEYFSEYTTAGFTGYLRLILDLVLAIGLACIFIYFLSKYTNKKILLVAAIVFIVTFFIVVGCNLILMGQIFKYVILIFIVFWFIYNANNIRSMFGDISKTKSFKGFVSDEGAREELIETLIKTVEYLSSRQIGAIITIEKEDSLNSYINKGTKLNSEISFELLTTIFMPGTALHDGAVIIRGHNVMCAGAFYPSTDKNDIPKNYGSRHRAAIGISEVTDAFTIVVSEETGRVALTIAGTLTPDVSMESLRVFLKQNIIVE